MYYFIHFGRWFLRFLKFPKDFFEILLKDFKRDYINKKKYKYNFIFIIGLPKSGTTLIENILSAIGYVDMKFSPLRIYQSNKKNHPHDISRNLFKHIPKKKLTYLKLHTRYNKNNFKIIKKVNPKIIFSFRNLKDVMISRYCHILSDKSHRQHKTIKDLDLISSFQKSLTSPDEFNNNLRPIDEFSSWIRNWKKKQISMNNLNLNYEEYKKNKIGYISKILNYLEIKDISPKYVLKKTELQYKKFSKNSLEDNLKNYLKPQTLNTKFDIIKKTLSKKNLKILIKI